MIGIGDPPLSHVSLAMTAGLCPGGGPGFARATSPAVAFIGPCPGSRTLPKSGGVFGAQVNITLAEREGFEPSVPRKVQRFSRPPRSTTPAPLHRRDVSRLSPSRRERNPNLAPNWHPT